MNILIVGSGGREHAIAWKIQSSPQASKLFMAPGNAGTFHNWTNLPVDASDIGKLIAAAKRNAIDLTIVGPENPLAAGIVDEFNEAGLAIFGPTKAAAEIEASKGFAKNLMKRYHIPCADGLVFDCYIEAQRFVEQHDMPLVIKADGLAAGKGVMIANTRPEALRALDLCFKQRVFGPAGDRVVLEETLSGQEVSVFTFTDGTALSPTVAACDYKRLLNHDLGPNTGGMGSYSSPEFWTTELAENIHKLILQPTVKALAYEGSPYRGVLYGGIMLTKDGPKVLEFNCRFGDPETQVILPRLQTDLIDIAAAILAGTLENLRITWSAKECVGVVLTSSGYPNEIQRGLPIKGLDDINPDILIFHGSTKLSGTGTGPHFLTDGGRVLTVVGTGYTLEEARNKAYQNVRRIHFEGMHYRNDISANAHITEQGLTG